MPLHFTNYRIDRVWLATVVDGIVSYLYAGDDSNPFKVIDSPGNKVVFVVRGICDNSSPRSHLYDYVAYDGNISYNIKWHTEGAAFRGELIETQFSDETIATVLTSIKSYVAEQMDGI